MMARRWPRRQNCDISIFHERRPIQTLGRLDARRDASALAGISADGCYSDHGQGQRCPSRDGSDAGTAGSGEGNRELHIGPVAWPVAVAAPAPAGTMAWVVPVPPRALLIPVRTPEASRPPLDQGSCMQACGSHRQTSQCRGVIAPMHQYRGVRSGKYGVGSVGSGRGSSIAGCPPPNRAMNR